METNRLASVIGANGIALAMSYTQTMSQLIAFLQASALLGAAVFTALQINRAWRRRKRELRLVDLIRRTQLRCKNAVEGNCPVADLLDEMDKEKD
jgi:hypothetical protein